MKYYLLLTLSFFFLTNGLSQDDGIEFQEVVKLENDSIPKNILYTNAKIWFVDAFKDSKEVIQMDDKENGIIIGKGNMAYTNSKLRYKGINGRISFTVKVEIKEGRYRYSFSDFYHETNVKNGYDMETIVNGVYMKKIRMVPKKYAQDYNDVLKAYCKDRIELLSKDLKESMDKSNVAESSDW